jgi:excinuclease UvrABC nuclease subunit
VVGGVALTPADIPALTQQMIDAAENLRFEEAARLRDRIKALEAGQSVSADDTSKKRKPQKGRYRKKR